MKIVVLITGLGMGGAERQVCDLVDQFSAMGHQLLLIAMTGELINLPKSKSIEVISLNMAKSPVGLVKAYLRARELIKNFRPDVVHSHMVHANIFSRLLRLSVSFPKLICTAHSTNEGGRMRVIAYRLTDSLCDFSTNVSQEAANAFVLQGAVPAGRMLAVHNGVDSTRFSFNMFNRQRCRAELGLTDRMTLLLAVGRLHVKKDYPNLINALHTLSISHSQVQLAIIGVGEEYEILTELVSSLGLTGRVHFLGMKHDVHEWMSAADVFVLSSALEGFGLVVAEAMACKRIVVATDCGGVKEVVGNCGIVVPPKNHIALAHGIEKALKMGPDAVEALGAAARERVVTCYSLNAQAKRWLSLYQ